MQYIKVTTSQEVHDNNNAQDKSTLSFAQTAKPEISADECLIKVAAIGVNRADLLQRAGKYPAPVGESDILGLEVCGEIVALGSDSQPEGSQNLSVSARNEKSQYKLHKLPKEWQQGDKVFTLVPGGGYAQYVKAKTSQLFKLPSGFSVEQGAACAEVFLTAYQSLFTIADLPSFTTNAKVLIHAGASGVGSAAIQLAKSYGCFVVVTVSNEAKREMCLALGADHVINYHETDYVLWSKQHVPSGFNIIVDVVAGQYLTRNINVTALDGHIVILSMLGGRFSEPVDMAKLLAKRITISASTLRNRSDSYKNKLVADFRSDFYQMLADGTINPVIDIIYSWAEADVAHQKMAANQNKGKLVLTIT